MGGTYHRVAPAPVSFFGALVAILAAAGGRYDQWLRFLLPVYLGVAALGVAAIVVGISIGLS